MLRTSDLNYISLKKKLFKNLGAGPEKLENAVAAINEFKPTIVGLLAVDWISLSRTKLLQDRILQPHGVKVDTQSLIRCGMRLRLIGV
jgi:hypothetical protein